MVGQTPDIMLHLLLYSVREGHRASLARELEVVVCTRLPTDSSQKRPPSMHNMRELVEYGRTEQYAVLVTCIVECWRVKDSATPAPIKQVHSMN